MNTYIALFRGINVGGNNLLPMKALVSILESMGARQIRTYIQSGNAVFQSSEQDPMLLSQRLAAEIQARHGFEPAILMLSLDAIKQAMAGNPFPEGEANPSSLQLGFLASQPENPNLAKLTSLKTDSERFQLIGQVFYLHAPDGIGRSKLAAGAEKQLGVPMTARNWNTVCKVMALAEA